MATLLELYNLRFTSQNLKNRTVAAIAKAAQDVLNEDAGTANHAARVAWASAALADTPTMAERMMWGMLANATIAAAGDAATDNDIQFVVNSLVDTFAAGV
jgi:hypothetical protein